MESDEQEVVRGEVTVAEWRLLRASAIDIQPNGMATGNSVAHVRVLDIPNATLYIVPVDRMALNALIGQATHILGETDVQTSEE